MSIFGPPDIDRLSEKGNVRGLIKALGYKKDDAIRARAAQALAWTGKERALAALSAIHQDQGETQALRQVAQTSIACIQFVHGALQNATGLRCRIRIRDIHRLYYAVALGIRESRKLDSAQAIALVESHLEGECPVCGQHVRGDTLSTVGTMQDSPGNIIIMGGMGETAALVAGKCTNMNCASQELVVMWR